MNMPNKINYRLHVKWSSSSSNHWFMWQSNETDYSTPTQPSSRGPGFDSQHTGSFKLPITSVPGVWYPHTDIHTGKTPMHTQKDKRKICVSNKFSCHAAPMGMGPTAPPSPTPLSSQPASEDGGFWRCKVDFVVSFFHPSHYRFFKSLPINFKTKFKYLG